MDAHLAVEALAAAGIVYGLLKVEQAYHIWRWKRARKQRPELRPDAEIKGLVIGAAEAVPCGRCGVMTTQFYEYADGDRRCKPCDGAEE